MLVRTTISGDVMGESNGLDLIEFVDYIWF